MVLIHIICDSPKQANEIVDFLIDEKLMLNPFLSHKTLYKPKKNGEEKSFEQTLVMGTTKALLFNTINKTIKKRFAKNPPLTYAMPIIYMDEHQNLELQTKTQKV
ncbi:hypothetical protein DKG77_05065 [Flagellimonas aquimarina]|uniref:Divalent cation tolerance protein CutA n=1 Tax=Flagellimonas aquimarina TaxID=2201895 RepID=A0A316L2Y2_9FLAO|nr:hypothetical protein [Allomuricauda koreensis]PWL40196.1 hypothetical protein DKG77_05065 [Allomuricauda koreensis]